ncbi:hypothetical protein FACS1894172_18020 [Spirochaetia bacterium]|nr:hypothetical protein FACS1894172_18020 [Spirochaetia bacterium]
MINRDTYILYIADNFLCVPAVLKTILAYYNINIRDIDITRSFDIFIPESCDNIAGIKSNNPNDYGAKLYNNTINKFFKVFNIPLKEEYISIFSYEDWEYFDESVANLLNTESNIICGFSYGTLYDEPENIEIGHVSIITNKNGNKIQILDPGPRNPGIKYVDSYNLYVSIKRKKDGLWLISQKDI